MQSATDMSISNVLPARLPKGFELGGYVVDGWLRDGGMAAIYRARRILDDRRVALKLQLPSTAHDLDICTRFDREAEVMARANGSPHVVELYDSGVLDDGRRYFVLEWVEGENLEELLDFLRNQDQRLPLPRACRIGRDVARGLAELHEHGVVHLDLKPANVMVAQGEDGGDEIKLVDFGIAADLHEGASAEGAAEGPVMGTSGYMCPEQMLGQASNPSFDVYALGVVLFEALSGSAVPRDGWKPETLPRLASLRRGVPERLAELVRGCMEFEPGRRPATAAAVVAKLEEVIRALEWESVGGGVGGGAGGGAGGGSRGSSEEAPVRSGGTEIVPNARVAWAASGAVQGAVRTGGTEIALTHEGVMLQSGLAVAVTAKEFEAATLRLEETRREETRVRRVWIRWAVVGGVGLVLVGGGAWLGIGGPEEQRGSEVEASDERVGASASRREPERLAVEPARVDPRLVSPVPLAVEDERPKMVEDGDGEPTKADNEAKDGAMQLPAVPSDADEPPTASNGKSRVDGPSAEKCKKARAEAVTAKGSRTWRKVLKVTSTRGCWTTADQRLERKQLRVEAYAELGESKKCVDEAGKIQDKQIEARVKLCRKQLGK